MIELRENYTYNEPEKTVIMWICLYAELNEYAKSNKANEAEQSDITKVRCERKDYYKRGTLIKECKVSVRWEEHVIVIYCTCD